MTVTITWHDVIQFRESRVPGRNPGIVASALTRLKAERCPQKPIYFRDTATLAYAREPGPQVEKRGRLLSTESVTWEANLPAEVTKFLAQHYGYGDYPADTESITLPYSFDLPLEGIFDRDWYDGPITRKPGRPAGSPNTQTKPDETRRKGHEITVTDAAWGKAQATGNASQYIEGLILGDKRK